MNKKGMDIDDLDEEDIEELEEEQPRKKFIKRPAIKKKPIQRFIAFHTPSRMGVVDAETNEVIAEGDLGIYEILAKIYSKLEKLEMQVGQIMEE